MKSILNNYFKPKTPYTSPLATSTHKKSDFCSDL